MVNGTQNDGANDAQYHTPFIATPRESTAREY